MLKGAGLGEAGGENTNLRRETEEGFWLLLEVVTTWRLWSYKTERETSFQVWWEMSCFLQAEGWRKLERKDTSGKQHRICITVKITGRRRWETEQAGGEGSFTMFWAHLCPNGSAFKGVNTDSKERAITLVCPSRHFSSRPCPLFKSSICRKQRSLQLYEPVSCPENTSFISCKCLPVLLPQIYSGLQLLCFPGELPTLHGFHYSLHKGCLQILPSQPFLLTLATDQWKGEHAAALHGRSRHLGFHLKWMMTLWESVLFSPPFLSWKSV